MRRLWRAAVLLSVIAGGALLFYGIRSNLRRDWFLAAVHERDVESVTRLLAQQPDVLQIKVMPQGSATPNRVRWRGRTPVHVVVTDNSGEAIGVADAMLAAGADFEARLDGDTPLHLAAEAGQVKMVAWLLDKGADVNARNGCEHPRDALCSSEQFADWQPFDRERSGGLVCTGCEHEGQTPLHAAQRSQHAYDVSTLLLARGADVWAIDGAGRTPLHVAAQWSPFSQDSRVLCGYGADPAVRDRQGKLPMDLARAAETAAAEGQPQTGERAGWLAPNGGCTRLAARAAAGTPVPADEVDAAWREYMCSRDSQWCPS